MFFPKTHEVKYGNTVKFLKTFPLEEFWRFFVERARYDYRETLYRFIYKQLTLVEGEELEKTSIETILNSELFQKLTLKEYKDLLKERGLNSSMFKFLNVDYKKSKKERLKDLLDKHQGWLGFESKEPGYLMGMTKGLCFILESIDNKRKLNVNLIKELHRLCMDKVKNTRENTKPGEFRSDNDVAAWDILPGGCETFEGLVENITYLAAIQGKYPTDMEMLFNKDEKLLMYASPKNNDSEIEIWTQKELGKRSYNAYVSFKNKNPEEIAKEIWAAAKEGKHVQYVTSENGGNLLSRIQEDCIQELESSLIKAKDKHEKLTAIFTFLKHVVLFHPFDDGVGRTYSMLLLQYLLMRENLMPVLLMDSNMIPGLSVQQLVGEYLRAEKEMEAIMEDPSYISSSKFVIANVDTTTLLKSKSSEEQTMFQNCLNLLKSNVEGLNIVADTQSAPEAANKSASRRSN